MSGPGPLVVRWHALELAPVEAGTLQQATVEVENAGSATWRTRGPKDGLFVAYHWLDERGNPIVWDGRRTPLERAVAPGETLRQQFALRAPIPPGRYRLAVDIVEELRFWLAELGNAPLEEEVDVAPRDASAARAFLPDGAEPAADWHELARALHAEGYSAVGGAVEPERGLLRRKSASSSRTRPAAGAIRAFRIRSSAPRCCRRSSRTRRWPGCRRTCPRATSRRCSTAGSCSDFDRDLIVDAREHPRADREREEARERRRRACRRAAAATPRNSGARIDWMIGDSGLSQWITHDDVLVRCELCVSG